MEFLQSCGRSHKGFAYLLFSVNDVSTCNYIIISSTFLFILYKVPCLSKKRFQSVILFFETKIKKSPQLTRSIVAVCNFHVRSVLVYDEWIFTFRDNFISSIFLIKIDTLLFCCCSFDILASGVADGVQIKWFVEGQGDSMIDVT